MTAWFAAEVSVHLDAVHRYFLRRAARQDADDLTAEVFETAWRRRDDVPRDHELPWLYRTAGFVLANHRRRAKGLPLQLAEEPVDGDHAHRIAERDRISRALAALSERDREILLLHAWEGLNGEELAEALGVSRSGAHAALSRARARLRGIWGTAVQDGTDG
ncbi:RNA polymerase sigma factor [Microbacterium sp.]|uniref:RNA polymerase sigma factor n=1 Tax=Microbacterium sp. TaxID=51671 RepID=UPI0039E55DC2